MRQRKTRCFLLLSITLAFCSLVTAKTPSKSTTSWQFFMKSNYARIQPAEQKNTYKLSIPRLAIQSLVAYSGAKKEKVISIPITPVNLESLFQNTNFKTNAPNAVVGFHPTIGMFVVKRMQLTSDHIIFTLKSFSNRPQPTVTGALILVIDGDAITDACESQKNIGSTLCEGLIGGAIGITGAGAIAGGVYGGIMSGLGSMSTSSSLGTDAATGSAAESATAQEAFSGSVAEDAQTLQAAKASQPGGDAMERIQTARDANTEMDDANDDGNTCPAKEIKWADEEGGELTEEQELDETYHETPEKSRAYVGSSSYSAVFSDVDLR